MAAWLEGGAERRLHSVSGGRFPEGFVGRFGPKNVD
jgi:hypothetical protein